VRLGSVKAHEERPHIVERFTNHILLVDETAVQLENRFSLRYRKGNCMGILTFKITGSGSHPFQTRAVSPDEVARELPSGFYTTFSTLASGTKVLGFRAHLQRLYAPSTEQGISPSVREDVLRARIAELCKLNLPLESRIRLILTKNNGMIYAVVQAFTPLPRLVYEDGVSVITAEMSRIAPNVKDTGFISASIAQREKVGGKIFEVLLTKEGRILEGMTSNFYAVKGSSLLTAGRGILPGVTRRVILRIARGEGMSLIYRSPRVDEKFHEAFLTSSSRGVVPIIAIDGKPVGQGRPGKWTNLLSKAYQAYVQERSENIAG
jgi:branched-chain amino acid aminotransferase